MTKRLVIMPATPGTHEVTFDPPIPAGTEVTVGFLFNESDRSIVQMMEERRQRLADEFDRKRAFGYSDDQIDATMPNPFRGTMR